MIASALFKKLHAEGFISGASLGKIIAQEKEPTVSVHWELKTILYLGVLLLSGGLCILIYKNIDTIGHQVILALIACITAACFYYCGRNKLPFSYSKIESPNVFFDYVLLLGCLMFITFLAYLQFQYNVFGSRYGLATFIPMVVLFFVAYYFDHLGILSMAITNFAAWMGLTVTPMHILESNDFADSRIIFTAIGVGILLLAVAWFTRQRKIKPHFEFTYNNFGTHILYISLLAAMFHFESIYLLWALAVGAFSFYCYISALKDRSFYFIVITVLYGYIALSYIVIRLLFIGGDNIGLIYLGIMYFIASAVGMVLFLINTNKKLKAQ